MKVLLDTCVWGGARAELQGAGHDVLWTGDLAQDPGEALKKCQEPFIIYFIPFISFRRENIGDVQVSFSPTIHAS
jgi:hypothetical protein